MPNIWTGKLHKAQSIVGSLQIILNPIWAHISGSLIVFVTMLGVSVTSYQSGPLCHCGGGSSHSVNTNTKHGPFSQDEN